MAQFEAAAQAAMDSIPEEFQPYLENTMFIVEEVRRTILHEVGHHFGMDEDDLPF